MNYLVFFIVPLVSGSINSFEEFYDDPSFTETKIFNELLAKFLKLDFDKKDVSGILSTFEKPFIKTFACDPKDVNELVVNVVETRVGGFSTPDELEKGVILGGTYTWQCKITTSEEGIITVDCDNLIKLNPDVISAGKKDPRVHEAENLAIFYHELLHGQLMLDAISSSIKWKNDVCNKKPSGSIDLSYSDRNHKVIGPLQTDFTEKLVEQMGGIFIKKTITSEETQNGKFSTKIFTRDDYTREVKVSYRTLNIPEPTVTFPEGDIFLSGTLKDTTKSGTVWMYVFEGSEIVTEMEKEIPTWIKKNAGWWYEGTITDLDFLKGIEYLVINEIIQIHDVQNPSNQTKEIPSWLQNTARWWANGLVSDREFVSGIKYLIEEGIIVYK